MKKHLILWDGECGFCKRSVKWLLAHDRFGHLRAQPNQEADISPQLRAACQNSVHVVKNDGEILRGGRAVLFCGQQTRWHQLARIAGWPVFLPFIELGYAIIAKNRLIFSKFLFTPAQVETQVETQVESKAKTQVESPKNSKGVS